MAGPAGISFSLKISLSDLTWTLLSAKRLLSVNLLTVNLLSVKLTEYSSDKLLSVISLVSYAPRFLPFYALQETSAAAPQQRPSSAT